MTRTATIMAMGTGSVGGADIASVIIATQASALKAYWKCDEPSGTTLADSSGNSKTLTIEGTINTNYWLGESGQSGTCFRTDGTVGRAARTDSVIGTAPTDFTFFCLVKGGTDFTGGVYPNAVACNYRTSSTNLRFLLGAQPTAALAELWCRGNSTTSVIIDAGTAFDGTWHSIASRRNGNVFTLFVDGAAVGSPSTVTLAAATLFDRTFLMGLNYNVSTNTYAKGSIQHAAIWDNDLTDGEIAAIHDAGF